MLDNKRQNQMITFLIITFLILLYISTWAIHNIVERNKTKDSITIEIENKNEEIKEEETDKKQNNNEEDKNEQSQNNSNEENNQNNGNNQGENQEGNKDENQEENENIGEIVDNKDRIKIMENGIAEWSELKELSIFNNYYYEYKPIIAPGVSGTYNFTVENISNNSCIYNLQFEEDNYYNINMVYKLKLNGKYISEDENMWLKINDIKIQDELLNGNKKNIYTLEWKWQDSENDTQIGITEGANYKLKVAVNAVEKEGM